MTAEVIYVLCAATSLFCFALLFRAYFRTKSRALLWSSAGFLAFMAANLLLVLDLVLLPKIDLSLLRSCVTLVGVVLLLCGLLFNS